MDAIAHSIRQNRAYYCLECGKCTAVCPISRREVGYSPRSMVEATINDRGARISWPGNVTCEYLGFANLDHGRVSFSARSTDES